MRLRLIRHATLELDYGGRRLLVDPMLDPAEARGPVANTPNDRRNPLVELPEPAEDVAARAEVVLVTHLHADHLDDTAVALLKGDRAGAVPAGGRRDAARARVHRRAAGGRRARVSTGCASRAPAGSTAPARSREMLAPVSGFVLRATGEPTVYIAGDTIWCDEVARRARRARARRRGRQRRAARASPRATRSS